ATLVDILERARRGLANDPEHPGARLARRLPALRHHTGRMLAQTIGDGFPAPRLAPRHAERAPDRGEHRVAHSHGFFRRFHCDWKVAPCGAGKSRSRVHPEASGSRRKRPENAPSKASARMPIAIAKP